MRYVMSYFPAEGFASLAREHSPAHKARLQAFYDRGLLLMAGPLDEPSTGQALGIFTSREGAEEFIAGDPFVQNGVVARWDIRSFSDFFEM